MKIGARRITISTSGLILAIDRLAQEGLQVELSISLHAAEDRVRSELMPINRKYSVSKLMDAAKRYMEKTKRQITFEYTMIQGVNCSPHDAQNLASLLQGFPCKVNVIPMNPIDEVDYEPPSREEIDRFIEELRRRGVRVTERKTRGRDINAACGQLRAQKQGRIVERLQLLKS